MRFSWLGFGVLTLGLTRCSSFPDDPCANSSSAACASADGGNPGVDAGADAVPSGCILTKEPSESVACVANEVGIFVDAAGGKETNAGTKDSPVNSVTSALGKLGGRSRIYVCSGTYAERVKLPGAVSLYGGWECGTWSAKGAAAKFVPKERGYALEVGPGGDGVVISDLSFTSLDGVDAGESSVAVFVHDSPNVTLRRVSVTAGKGVAAADPSATPSNLFTGEMTGNPAMGANGAGGTTS
jgi:hypothetical protein